MVDLSSSFCGWPSLRFARRLQAFARSGKLSFVGRSSPESGVPCRWAIREFQWEKSWEKWWLKWVYIPKKCNLNGKNDDQLDSGFGDTHGTRFSEPIKAGNEETMSIIVLDFPELVVGLQNWPRLWSLDWVCRSRVLSGHWDIHITTVNPTSYKGG